MKVYVLILWGYDGDSYLTGTYEGVFSSYDDASNAAEEDHQICSTEEAEVEKNKHGRFRDPSFYEIKEEHVL